jgi:hypothetical protein
VDEETNVAMGQIVAVSAPLLYCTYLPMITAPSGPHSGSPMTSRSMRCCGVRGIIMEVGGESSRGEV